MDQEGGDPTLLIWCMSLYGVQGQTLSSKRTAVALTFLRVAQVLLQEVQQSLSGRSEAMDLDEEDEQPTGAFTFQSGAPSVISLSLCAEHDEPKGCAHVVSM